MLNIGDYVVIQLHKRYDYYNYEYKLGEVVKVTPRLDVVSDGYYFSPPRAKAHEDFAAERFIIKLKRQGWRGEAGIVQNFRYLVKLPGGELEEIELSDTVQVPSFHVMCQIMQCPESIQNRLLESMVTMCDINETDRAGNTILHANNVLRNVELVRTLLSHGAKNVENICGLTPYEIAVLEGYSSSAAAIEKHCGKPDRSNIYQSCKRLLKKYDLSTVLDFCHFSHKYREQALVIAIEMIPQCGKQELLGAANSISKLHCGLQDIILPYYKQAVKPYILDNIEQYVTNSEDRLFLYEIFDTAEVFSQLWKEYFLSRRECVQKEILDLFFQDSTFREEVYEECFNSKDSWKKCWAITYRHKHTRCGWDELKPCLLSKNTELQSLAGFVLEKEMDVPLKDFYRQHLGDENPLAAIKGILKYGDEEAGMDLLKHINDYHGRCLYTAIQALASTLREKAIDTYWHYLQYAPSYKVAKEACRALKKCGCRDMAEYGPIQSEFGKIIVEQMYQ